MITLFSTPKHFIDIFYIIQKNALKSWRALSPDIQIIIFGDSKGSKEAAKEIGAEHIPNVKCSPEGTPLLSDLFLQADKRARYPIMTFINADIILPEDFLKQIQIVSDYFNKFLIIGHRWDMDVEDKIEFNNDSEQQKFWDRVRIDSKKHACTGIDYFIYKRFQWRTLPNFIIGRPGFDNWLIWKARRKLLPIIDATKVIQAVHQNHYYDLNIRKREGNVNRELHKGKTLNILDSTYKISKGKIAKKNDKNSVIRSLYRLPKIFPEIAILIKIYRRIYFRFVLK